VEPHNPNEKGLPTQTLEVVAKSFYKQSLEYGFRKEDYLRFVNILLDLGLGHGGLYVPPPSSNHQDSAASDVEQESEQVTVRLYQLEDHELLKRWIEDEEGRQFLTTRPEAPRFNTLEALLESETSRFGIVSLSQRPIGALAYLNIDSDQHKAELRKLIGDPLARGHGYAKKATQYWIEYGISTLGLRKIYVNTLETHLKNIRLNEQLGFRVEGLLRDEVLLDGEYRDVLRMSLIMP